jgi:hypothetical protein
MNRFKGKARTSGISLPEDMWTYLRERAKREDRSLSMVVLRAIEKDIFAEAERATAAQDGRLEAK